MLANASSHLRSIPLAQGRIAFLGGDLAGVPTYRRSRLGIGFVPEDRRIFRELTVRENLEAAREQQMLTIARTLLDKGVRTRW